MDSALTVLQKDLSQYFQMDSLEESEYGSLMLAFDEQVTVNIYPHRHAIMLETQLMQLPKQESDHELILKKVLEIMLIKARDFPDNVYLEENSLILQWLYEREKYEKTFFTQRLQDHVHLSHMFLDTIG